MNRKRALILILILITSLFPLISIPIAKASSITVSISNDYDDVWMTESGNIFSSVFMVMILDDAIGIQSFLRFQNLQIAKNAKINYATLKVYVAETQETPDPGSSVTIYGIDEPDCAPFSVGSGLWSLSRPYTSASVNWNTTVWAGYQSVNVTDIVKEIINQYAWNKGNDLGLQIIGASDSGQSPRSFEDYYHMYHEGQAQLTIVYDVIEEEDPPEDDFEFVEQYGEYTIWVFNLTGIEYIFMSGTSEPYDIRFNYIGSGPETTSISQTEDLSVSGYGGYEKIIRTSNGNLYVVFYKVIAGKRQIHVKKSINNGTTWIDEKLISTYAGMGSYNQTGPVIAVDSDDNLHVFWYGKATGYTAGTQIWYRNYTTSWGTIKRFYIDYEPWEMHLNNQNSPCIRVDSNDYLHVVWFGIMTGAPENQIYYQMYNSTHWINPRRVSYDIPGMTETDQRGAVITIDKDDYVHVVWRGLSTAFPTYKQIWYRTSQNGWPIPERISTYAGMNTNDQNVPDIAVDSNDYIHVVWFGKATGYPDDYQIWYAKNTTSWSAPLRISTYAGMNTNDQMAPSIAVDSEDHLHVLFHGKATGFLDYNKIWYALYNTSWITPDVLQPTGQNTFPNIRWSRWPVLKYIDLLEYFVTDENGTLIDTWTDNDGKNHTDIDELKDFIDDYIDPGGGDPLDPDPGTQGWATEGPFTRFNMRLYFLFIGLGCIFGPLWAMAYKKFDAVGYAWCFIIIVLGTGILWSITGI